MARFLIVEARFYEHLNDMLIEGAASALAAAGHTVDKLTVEQAAMPVMLESCVIPPNSPAVPRTRTTSPGPTLSTPLPLKTKMPLPKLTPEPPCGAGSGSWTLLLMIVARIMWSPALALPTLIPPRNAP